MSVDDLTARQVDAWRVGQGVAALLAVVPATSIGTAAALWWWPGTVAGEAIFGVCKVWVLLVPLIWLWLVDRKKMVVSRPAQSAVAVGLIVGVVIGAAIFGAFLVLRKHWIHPATVAAMAHTNHLDVWWVYVGFAAFESLVNSLLEEYVWRWFVVRKCALIAGPRTAVALSALLFTVHHVVALSASFNWKITVLASIGVFAGGLIWSGIYLRYKSIWPGYVSHVLVDFAVFGVGGWIIFWH